MLKPYLQVKEDKASKKEDKKTSKKEDKKTAKKEEKTSKKEDKKTSKISLAVAMEQAAVVVEEEEEEEAVAPVVVEEAQSKSNLKVLLFLKPFWFFFNPFSLEVEQSVFFKDLQTIHTLLKFSSNHIFIRERRRGRRRLKRNILVV